MASATLQAGTGGSEPEKKKTLFDIVLTSTPVILTVIATFLVGQSTGEMTRAQYFRALASQNQSKAGDQWSFFQAKRMRGQDQEVGGVLLLAQNQTLFTRNTFLEVAQGMVRELQSAEKAARTTNDKAVADDLQKLIPEAEKALAQAKSLFGSADGKGPATVQPALDALLKGRPKSKTTTAPDAAEADADISPEEAADRSEQAALLKAVIEDIKQKKPDSAIAGKAIKIKEDTLAKAIAAADRRAFEINKKGKSIESVLVELDGLRDRQTELARAYQEIVGRDIDGRGLGGVLERQTHAIRVLTAKVQGDYMAVKLVFGARRYEDDARSNQDSAYLYEVKVYVSSAQSDKHLFRSQMFLLAMLAAQAGVTISTLALAVKHKSIFWALAALTGMIAIGFGAYVYLDVGPIPMLTKPGAA